jgi:hypothetical protein
MWIRTYGNLYRKLVITTGEVPLGIYRKIKNHEENKQISVSSL